MIKKLLAGLLAFFMAAVAFATEVNTATQAELDAVKGIGPALSARIVDARKTGPFKDWGDLVTRVKGVGEKNSTEFSAGGLTVNGAAKSGAPAVATATRKSATKASASTTTTTAAAAPVAATSPSATPAASPAASAPMTAADKKAARKAAKEEKARLKAAGSATGAASPASMPMRN